MIDAAIRAVYFDAIGTLISPKTPIAQTYSDCARRHGASISADEARTRFRDLFAGEEERDLHNCWRTDEARERSRWQVIVTGVLPDGIGEACFKELWNWFGTADAWSVCPDAADVLSALARRGLTVGMASNFDSRLIVLLENLPELAEVRNRCVVSSLVGWRKPAREFFAAVAQSAGCAPGQVLYVGDDVHNDIDGAVAAGMSAVFFDPKGTSEVRPRIRQLRDLLPLSGVIQ